MRITQEAYITAGRSFVEGRFKKNETGTAPSGESRQKSTPPAQAQGLLTGQADSVMLSDALSDTQAQKNEQATLYEQYKKEKHPIQQLVDEMNEKKKEGNQGQGVDDPTARLTRRLVSAKVRDEVLAVMSEAYKALGEALKAAAGGDKEALEVVRRLNKLIRRVSRKLNDLEKETDLKRKEKRAEEKELEELARLHEQELKRRMAERKRREKKYLQDPDAQDKQDEKNIKISISSMSKAELEAMMRKLMPLALSVIKSGHGDFSNASFAFGSGGGELSTSADGESATEGAEAAG